MAAKNMPAGKVGDGTLFPANETQPLRMSMNEYVTLWILGIIIVILLVTALFIKGYIDTKKRTSESKTLHWFNEHQAHAMPAFLILFLLCVCFSTFFYSKYFLPRPLASPADATTAAFHTTLLLTGIAFFVTQVLLFYFAFRFRTKPQQRATYIIGKIKLEILWIAIPFAAFIFLFLWGQVLWGKFSKMPDDALEIEVLAAQFNWRVRYAGDDKKLGRADFRLISTDNELGIDMSDPNSRDDVLPLQMHIPKNRPIKITLRSKDVIHSFFIPHFGMKMDAVPGMTTQMHFTPTRSTNEMRKQLNNPNFDYEVACAELCGRMHFGMKMILIVDEPSAFDEWYKSQKKSSTALTMEDIEK